MSAGLQEMRTKSPGTAQEGRVTISRMMPSFPRCEITSSPRETAALGRPVWSKWWCLTMIAPTSLPGTWALAALIRASVCA
jgi:hypothetical protein